ncbi:MAG: radical SAM protein [bacterium]
MPLILNPEWKMRKESGYVLLYRITDIGTIVEQSFIHPLDAIVIALFDGERTVEEVTSVLNYITGHPVNVGDVELFIDKNSRYFVESSDILPKLRKKYDPLEFVMSADSVDFIERRPIAPLWLIFMITNDCRADCIYCYAEKQRYGNGGKPLSLSRIKELIKESAELHIPSINFTGGDPFMHPHILDILEYTIANDILPVVSTKCALSPEVVDRLAEIGMPRVQISIDSYDPETNLFMIGVKDYLEEMIPVIRRLKIKEIKTVTKTVVTPYNLYQIPFLVDLLVSLGVDNIGLSEYIRSLHHHPGDELFLSYDQLKWLTDEVGKLREKYGFSIISFDSKLAPEPKDKAKERAFSMRVKCTAGIQQLAIYPDGKVVPCEETPSTPEFVVGDLSKESILEVWNSERLIASIRPPRDKFFGQPCYDCLDFYECHAFLGRCFIHSLKVYGTKYAPAPECPKAPFTNVRLQSSPVCVDPKPMLCQSK